MVQTSALLKLEHVKVHGAGGGRLLRRMLKMAVGGLGDLLDPCKLPYVTQTPNKDSSFLLNTI